MQSLAWHAASVSMPLTSAYKAPANEYAGHAAGPVSQVHQRVLEVVAVGSHVQLSAAWAASPRVQG